MPIVSTYSLTMKFKIRLDWKEDISVNIFTCLMAVTVITKKSGSPLVTGLVGVSTVT